MSCSRLHAVLAVVVAGALHATPVRADAQAGTEDTIAKIKPSVVAVGTFQPTRAPAFQFRGTGFVVGDGTLVATNAHVLPATLDKGKRESLAILVPTPAGAGSVRQVQFRIAREVARDTAHDLALLRIDGTPLPALTVGDSSSVREGRSVHFTGFPIGAVLGVHAATHRAIIAAISPIAIPQRRDTELDAATIKRLAAGAFPMFQLDGIAYAGNSGSPVFDAAGSVIGVINMVLVRASKESLLTQPSGIAYAIPSAHLSALIESVR